MRAMWAIYRGLTILKVRKDEEAAACTFLPMPKYKKKIVYFKGK